MSEAPQPPQRNLFEWLAERRAPRGAVSVLGVRRGDVDAEAVRALHGRLEAALGTVDLVVTDNRRRMVTARKRRGRYEIRTHHMFVGADDDVVAAVAALARGERWARSVVQEFIADHRDEIRPRAPRTTSVSAAGAHHDLLAALARASREDAISEEAIAGVTIGWGRRGRGRRSIRFGSFDFEQRLVRIHPALDAAWVPEYFLDFVVYHELLHAVVPPERDAGGRRVLHPPEFRRLEEAYSRYEEAMQWESDNLRRLLQR